MRESLQHVTDIEAVFKHIFDWCVNAGGNLIGALLIFIIVATSNSLATLKILWVNNSIPLIKKKHLKSQFGTIIDIRNCVLTIKIEQL